MRLYRLLLHALPEGFRSRHGDEMERVFSELLAEARRSGRIAVWGLYMRSALDIARRTWWELGGVERREGVGMDSRTWLDQVTSDLRSAIRGLRRMPGFFMTAACTLALGVGAVTAVFSVVNGVVLRPLPYPDAERLMVVYNQYPALDVSRGSQTPGDLDDYRELADLMSHLGSVSTYPQTILEDGRPRREAVALVTPGFFSMLGVEPQLGRDIDGEDDHDVVLVSHGYWMNQLGGDPDVLGTTLAFAGVSKTVIGVLPPDFRLVVPSNFGVPPRPSLWSPIPAQGWGRDTGDRTAHWMNIVGRLRPSTTLAQAQEQMDAIAAGQRELLPRRAERDARIAVIPLHDEVVRDVKPALLALLAAAGMVVLIACANVANLLLARTQRRQSEMAIRAALGAGRLRIVRQLITEGAVLGATGALVGTGVAWLGLTAVVGLEPGNLPRVEDVRVDTGVLAFVAALTGFVTLLFSVAPAWLATRQNVALTMRDAQRSGPSRRGNRLSSTLIIGELALSLVLLTGGGLLVRSFLALTDTDPGFLTERVLTFRAPLPASNFQGSVPAGYSGPPAFNPVRKPYYDRLSRALTELPGVEAVGAVFPTPLAGGLSGSTYRTEATAGQEEGQMASSQLVTPEYFETMGIPFLAGRTFLPDEVGDKLVIDRAMAETVWPGERALGKRLEVGWWSGAVWGEVVGVVENVRTHSLMESNPPTVYRLGTVYAYSAMTMVLRVAGDPLALAPDVREAVVGIEAEAPVIDLRLMSDYVADQSARTRLVLSLVGLFAALAIGLAAIGLYGVISYAVGQRVREYGIRLALGARQGQVFRLVLRRGFMLTALGVALGVAGAFAVQDLIEPFLFGVQPTDPVTFAAIVAAVGLVAFVACAAPAGRATSVDPVASLRSE